MTYGCAHAITAIAYFANAIIWVEGHLLEATFPRTTFVQSGPEREREGEERREREKREEREGEIYWQPILT